jgi:hypothetical protein
MNRLKRYAQRRDWRPYRELPRPADEQEPGPRGELYELDAAGNPGEKIHEPVDFPDE